MLELYYNFFDKFYDVNKLEELEMETDLLYLALAEENFMIVFVRRKKVTGKN